MRGDVLSAVCFGARIGCRDFVFLPFAQRCPPFAEQQEHVGRCRAAPADRCRSAVGHDPGGQQSGEYLHRHSYGQYHRLAFHVPAFRIPVQDRVGDLPAAALRRDPAQGAGADHPREVRLDGGPAPRAAAVDFLPAVVHPRPHEQPHQRKGRPQERNIVGRTGRRRGHDPEHEPRGARDAVGDRQLRQYRGAGDHETPRGHHGARCHGRLRNGQEDDHRIGILAHPGLRGGYRQHPRHALRQGPAALHQQRQRFRLAAAGPQTLLRARAQEDQRPAGRFPVEQGPHGHRRR